MPVVRPRPMPPPGPSRERKRRRRGNEEAVEDPSSTETRPLVVVVPMASAPSLCHKVRGPPIGD